MNSGADISTLMAMIEEGKILTDEITTRPNGAGYPSAVMSHNGREKMQLLFMPQDDNFWRIDWFGDVHYPNYTTRRSMPSISIVLSSWRNSADAEPWDDTGADLHIHAPVGFLGKLRIGDIWQNGQLVETPKYCLETFLDITVNRNTTSIIKSGLGVQIGNHNVFYLPLQQHPHHAAHTQSYCLKVELPENKRLIIPAIELIRFYFGSSSGLLSRLFQFPLMPDKLWIEAERGVGRKKAKIVLAAGISGWSAADIARISFDPVAWHSAQLVGNSLSAARISRQPLYPKAHFPFDGITTLRASGVWLPFGDDPAGTFLVYRLLSCSHRFPFRRLEYRLAGRVANTDSQKEADSEKLKNSPVHSDAQLPKIFVPAKRISKKYVEQDPSKKLGTAEHVIEKTQQFPDLRFKSVCRAMESVPSEVQVQLLPGKPVMAASVGTGGMSDDIRPVDLVLQSGWNVQKIESHMLMRDLVAELSISGKFDIVEVICVKSHQEDTILAKYGEALWRNNGGRPWNTSSRNRMPIFSNIQIASATKGSMVAFFLIAEVNRAIKFAPLCVAVKPRLSKMAWTVAEDVIAALDLPRFPYPEEITDHDISPHFIPVPSMILKRDLSYIVSQLGRRVELYWDVLG